MLYSKVSTTTNYYYIFILLFPLLEYYPVSFFIFDTFSYYVRYILACLLGKDLSKKINANLRTSFEHLISPSTLCNGTNLRMKWPLFIVSITLSEIEFDFFAPIFFFLEKKITYLSEFCTIVDFTVVWFLYDSEPIICHYEWISQPWQTAWIPALFSVGI